MEKKNPTVLEVILDYAEKNGYTGFSAEGDASSGYTISSFIEEFNREFHGFNEDRELRFAYERNCSDCPITGKCSIQIEEWDFDPLEIPPDEGCVSLRKDIPKEARIIEPSVYEKNGVKNND